MASRKRLRRWKRLCLTWLTGLPKWRRRGRETESARGEGDSPIFADCAAKIGTVPVNGHRRPKDLFELLLRNHRHPERMRLIEFAAHFFASDEIVGVFGDAGGGVAAVAGGHSASARARRPRNLRRRSASIRPMTPEISCSSAA